MQDMKQEALAQLLGISRQAVSKLEQSEFIDDEKLIPVAKALGLSVEELKSFNEDATINYIQHNYEGSNRDASHVAVGVGNIHSNINPLEKYIEMVEKNEKLYQQLIQSEREKVEMLQKLLEQK